jgi:hypothetical protein
LAKEKDEESKIQEIIQMTKDADIHQEDWSE